MVCGLMAGVAGPGCSFDSDPDPLIVFAASSLTDAFKELTVQYEASSGNKVILVTASSSALREQILDGAPASVIASANEAALQELDANGFIDQKAKIFAQNRLVIAVAIGNPLGIDSLEDLARNDVVVGACSPGVPCGRLAGQIFARIGVSPELDTREPNARQVLAKLVDGELDVGLVYASDVVAGDGRLQAIRIDGTIDMVAKYPIATLSNSADSVIAEEFVSWVLSDAGQSVLQKHGFELP